MPQSKHVRRIFTDYFIKLQRFKYVPVPPVENFRNPKSSVLESCLNQVIDSRAELKSSIQTAGYVKSVVDSTYKEFLNTVGTKEFDHTFQELYATCSFAIGSKKTACEEAFYLLTQNYKLNKHNLKMSFYGGDNNLHVDPDKECEKIWNRLGMPESALISGNMKSNFCEFKNSGKCGMSSGIYYIHPKGTLHEIWNLIFVTHERDTNGGLKILDTPYTVSGMLLESLTAALQGKSSNYDTDLFQPIIRAIQENCPSGIPDYQGKFGPEAYMDVAYRKLADHIRAIIICLADGIMPSTNLPLQLLMHEAFTISERVFVHPPGFLQELFKCVSDILAEYYPEMESKAYIVNKVLESEENIYKSKNVVKKKAREYFTPSWFDDEEIFNQRIGELFNNHLSVDETSCLSEDELNEASKVSDENTDVLENMDKQLRRNNTKSVTDLITQEMLGGIEESKICNRSYMVHFLACSYLMEFVSLSEDVLEISDIPVMLFACCNGVMKVSCRVPKPWMTTDFNAANWLSQVTSEFNSCIDSDENVENLKVFASMKGTKVSLITCESLVQNAMKKAIAYIKKNMPNHPAVPDKKNNNLQIPKLSKRS